MSLPKKVTDRTLGEVLHAPLRAVRRCSSWVRLSDYRPGEDGRVPILQRTGRQEWGYVASYLLSIVFLNGFLLVSFRFTGRRIWVATGDDLLQCSSSEKSPIAHNSSGGLPTVLPSRAARSFSLVFLSCRSFHELSARIIRLARNLPGQREVGLKEER